MRATWRAARAAVRKRRLQTLIIGVVVLVSTATIVLALGLLATVDAPFDKAFARLQGAHLNVSYDGGKVSADRLGATAHLPGVKAAAGPFASVVVETTGFIGLRPGPITVVGRADQNGPVDHLVLTEGRWLAGPGEIVIRRDPHVRCGGEGCSPVGKQVEAPGRPRLTIVGVVRSITQSADAWVTPAQAQALHPRDFQMLYRFTDSSTKVSAVTTGLPSGAVTGSQSYLVPKLDSANNVKVAVPFLLVFGVLGLIAAVLIIGNVVSGAVVSGYRHIGVLKALGFTPAQVSGVYVVMIAVPGVVGCTCGVVIGNLLAKFLTASTGEALDLPVANGVAPWVDVAAIAGICALVVVTALVPAVRAGRLSAAQAVSAGAVPRRGRALRVQRVLAKASLPRPVSLGLGLPFARPGRSALTLAAVAFGVAAVTFATGLLWTIDAYSVGAARTEVAAVSVDTALPDAGPPPMRKDEPEPAPAVSGAQAESRLRGLPGTRLLTPCAVRAVHVVGMNETVDLKAYRDGFSRHGYDLARGRWLRGPAEVVVSSAFMKATDLKMGDTVYVLVQDRRTALRIVGEAVGEDQIITDWQTMSALVPGLQATYFEIGLKKGVRAQAYAESLHSVLGDRLGIGVRGDDLDAVLLGLVTTLTLGLTVVSTLGVFNTVVLNTRDRTRDFGILKSLGSTPRQIMAMVITSMLALGLAGGLIGIPVGVVAHHLVMPVTGEAGGVTLPDAYIQVYGPLSLVVLASAGVAIGILGALVPAGWASRLKTATALRSE
ncbi:ABC transporter permease [Actinomadura scrupuli]|uniref:ABC transporter permease n=1 Tax=Actinomadura scrupuli TaxID=559629 RepID=UPI003D960C74